MSYHLLQRVQNRTLFQQFVAKKKQMDSQNRKGTQNERMLWHGTAPTTVDSINAHGFNRSYCGKNAVAYGNGVYFAVNSQYSAQPQYSVQDANGYNRMYQCRVLTGEFTRGQGGMRVPPQKGSQGHILYDSVVDNATAPSIFVIFHDTQAYPEYIVTFS
ncbi:protein mono-ADP-ribosyltransferase PARP15-like [Pecten maximus]|uniref:protein mono-ADP-ribosyltransferase PARP15-like n=1 Tax=Pecten maximus TaxID=6579 RepID=UPI001458716B|nr:protein mono-ADP-ribosyltransferase PARP15-like [Pecten maximus]